MTESGGAIIFCRILAPRNDPPSPDATILNYLNDRERGDAIIFCKNLAPALMPRNAPPPPLTPQYLTILMTKRGDAIIYCMILAPPPPNAPSPDVTILDYLDDWERGRHYLCRIFAPLN